MFRSLPITSPPSLPLSAPSHACPHPRCPLPPRAELLGEKGGPSLGAGVWVLTLRLRSLTKCLRSWEGADRERLRSANWKGRRPGARESNLPFRVWSDGLPRQGPCLMPRRWGFAPAVGRQPQAETRSRLCEGGTVLVEAAGRNSS